MREVDSAIAYVLYLRLGGYNAKRKSESVLKG